MKGFTARSAEPRRRFGAVVALVGLLALVSVFLVGAFFYSRAAGCSAEERAVFQEFPQYGGREMEPESNTGLGSCAAYYETPDPPEQVQAYFAERLVANGWEVKARPEEFGEDEFGGTIITATRDGYYYDVSYESLEMYENPRPGVHLAVHVREA